MNPDQPTIIVTGSNGLIGSALCRRLAGDFNVVGFAHRVPEEATPGVHSVAIDLTCDGSVARAFETVRAAHGSRIASVIHLAAYYDFSGEPSPKYEEVNIRGTERLLRGLQLFEVGQFVFSSTIAVHAPCQPGERIDESWPLEPKWEYPKSKVKAEAIVREGRGHIPAAILRICGIYTDRCQSVLLAHEIQRIHERQLFGRIFPGDATHGQPFLHLDDLLDAIVALIERRGALPPETTFLLGEPETLGYSEIQSALGRMLLGEEWKTHEMPKTATKLGVELLHHLPGVPKPFLTPWMVEVADDHFAIDISAARESLGWSPRRSLRETLPAMVGALKADPAAWYRENKLTPAETGDAA